MALNCYVAKALPVKYQITAHRLCMAYMYQKDADSHLVPRPYPAHGREKGSGTLSEILSVGWYSLFLVTSIPTRIFHINYHQMPTFQLQSCSLLLASSPGPSQILSRSRGEKSGEGLGSKLSRGPEMVDSVSTNQVHITY